ncbi:MAG: hypothetical protein GY842_28945 [bacterium]|nr:hypothetical protein [bacterium]
MRCSILLSICVLAAGATPGWGDRLILTGGGELSGEVTKTPEGYSIVTADGETQTFTKAEVKRFIYESRVDPIAAKQMLQEVSDLVRPVLAQGEPNQQAWIAYVIGYAHGYSYRGGVISLSHIDLGDDRFVDAWVRYSAKFERLAENPRFQDLVSGRKGSGSLREFALHGPEDYKESRTALRLALNAVDACIKSALDTQRLIQSLPRQQHSHDSAIRKLADTARTARSRMGTATDELGRSRQKNRAVTAEDNVRKRITKMQNVMQRLTQSADRKINDLARQREVAKGQLATAAERLGVLLAKQPEIDSAPGAEQTLQIGDAVEQSIRLLDVHRAKSKKLTTLGLTRLRADTMKDMRECFIGRTFAMSLYVRDLQERGRGEYLLEADDRPSESGHASLNAELTLVHDLAEELILCSTGAHLIVDVAVREVSCHPGVEKLERSGVRPMFMVSGSVTAVRKACD